MSVNTTGLSDEKSWNVESSIPLLHSLVAGEELADMADERDDIVVLTADLMLSNRTSDFAVRHPARFINVGIAEQNMIGVAAGLAASDYIPYVSTFASFASLLCAEQLRTDLAYPAMMVRILAHHAGIAMGFYGTSHHAIEDIAITRSMSGMTVAAAADAASTRAILRATVDTDGPVYIRLGRGREKAVYDSPPELEVGKFIRVCEGTDAAVIATGIGVRVAKLAAEKLAGEGISVRVLDAAFIKPLDSEAIVAAARETHGIVVVEEHTVLGGLGGAVAEVIATSGLATHLALHGFQDEYAVIAPPSHLYVHYGFTADRVAELVRGVLP